MNAFELMATLSLNKDEYEKGLSDAENKGNQFGSTLSNAGQVAAAGLGAAVAAATAVSAALVKGVNDVADYGDNVDKMSQKMGISSKSYQEWDAVMRHCGTSIDALKPSMKTMANQAQQGAEEFQKLGISQEEVKTLSQEDLFGRVIEGLQNMEEGTERTAIASKLLGRGATELGALLNTSAEDTQKMKNRVNELGGVMSADAVKASAAFKDSLQDLQTSFDGLKRNLLGSFMPSMTKVMDGLTEIMAGNFDKGLEAVNEGVDEFIGTMNEVVPEMIEIGGKIIGAVASAIAANLPQIIEAGVKIIVELAVGIVKTLPQLFEAISSALKNEAGVIGGLLGGILDVVAGVFNFIIDHKDLVIGAIVGITAAFVAFKASLAIQSILPAIASGVAFLVTSFISMGGALGVATAGVEALNAALLTNPIGLIVGAIVAAVAVLGIAIYHIATEEEAVKSLDEATKNHEETLKNLTDAQSSYFSATKALTDAQNELAQAQEETGLSGEDLYNQFINGTLAYQDMNAEQQRVLEAYVDMTKKQQALKESTEELKQAQGEELVASFQQQASAIKENGGNWDELGAKMRKAYDEGKIGADELQELFGQAMTEMDTASKTTFVQNLPEDMRYATLMGTQEQETFGQRWEHFCSDIDALFGQTTDSVEQNSTDANTNVTTTWQDIGNWFSNRWDEISNAFSGAADWFRDKFETAKNNVTNIWSIIGQWFSDRWNDISNAFSGAADWFRDKFQSAIDFVTGIWSSIGQWFSDRWNDISNAFSGAGDWFAQKFNDAINGIKWIWSSIGQWFSDRWNDITGVFSGVADWFGFAFGVAKGAVEGAWSSIGGFFSGIWEDIKSAFDIGSLFEWGSHMIENFINGIKSAWEGLKSVVTGIGDFIASIFKHTTPKEGPLKDDDEWTEHMMQNFIDGIDKNKGKLKKTMLGVADMMAEPMTMNVDGVFSGASGRSASGYNQTINVYSPKALTPYEVARQTRNATRNMVLSMQGV